MVEASAWTGMEDGGNNCKNREAGRRREREKERNCSYSRGASKLKFSIEYNY